MNLRVIFNWKILFGSKLSNKNVNESESKNSRYLMTMFHELLILNILMSVLLRKI